LESVVAALDDAEDMATVCRAISQGSLMGARGNSGVILSQVLRGLAQRCQDSESLDASDLADALGAASVAAYKAVMNPVEGTILTVVKGAADGAAAEVAADDGPTLVSVLEAAHGVATETLARTPELLPVLKQAGVVDAGGAGFVLFLDAFLHVVDARPLPEPPPSSPAATQAQPSARKGPSPDLGPRYEVMHLLDAADDAVERLKQAWAGLGDSIAVVGDDGTWNCHVHTDDIGGVIEAAIGCGHPYRIRVTDLHEQVEAEHCAADPGGGAAELTVATAVVVVAAGDGLAEMFRSLGAHRVVAGGQSMNPSTAQLLEAVESAPAADVVILPNNPNIAAVAAQVHDLSTKEVRVVVTTSVAEGLAAMLEFDPGTRAEANQTAMAKAAALVVSGEIAQAVRASTCAVGPIAEGDWLGLSGRGIEVIAGTLAEAAVGLLERLVAVAAGDVDGHEVVAVIEGHGSSSADTRAITAWLAEHRPKVEAEVHHGGQPLYPYLFSIE
ncbi:MAG: DAK2 domain-containing protein, partial [Acidimicrobiales bacterium]